MRNLLAFYQFIYLLIGCVITVYINKFVIKPLVPFLVHYTVRNAGNGSTGLQHPCPGSGWNIYPSIIEGKNVNNEILNYS